MDIKRWTLTSISGQLNDSWNHLASGELILLLSVRLMQIRVLRLLKEKYFAISFN